MFFFWFFFEKFQNLPVEKWGGEMKIKYSLLDRMCELTNKELDIVLFMASK